MKYKTFTYQIPPPEEPEDLNGFLSSHRILSARPYMVTKDQTPYLVFIVEYLDNGKAGSSSSPKIDYREKLSEEDFAIFSKLRELRKTLAEKEGIPVYAIFTNAQLAEIAEKKIRNKDGMLSIQGIGKAKTEKYADDFIKLLQEII